MQFSPAHRWQHLSFSTQDWKWCTSKRKTKWKGSFLLRLHGFPANVAAGWLLSWRTVDLWIFDTQNSGLVSLLGHLGANKPSWAKPDERRVALRRGYGALCANLFSHHSMGWYNVQSQNMDTTALVVWGRVLSISNSDTITRDWGKTWL